MSRLITQNMPRYDLLSRYAGSLLVWACDWLFADRYENIHVGAVSLTWLPQRLAE